MNPLLFLGSEYLFRMTDPTVPDEEQESYRADLSAYLASEEGRGLAENLVQGFNEFEDNHEDIAVFPRGTMLWYIDWLAHQEPRLLVKLNTTVIDLLWQTYDEELLRTRAIELTLLVESAQEIKPRDSRVGIMFARAQESEEVEQKGREGYPIELELVDTLLTERTSFALRVLQSCVRRSRPPLRQNLEAHIRNRANQLGPEEESVLLAEIFPERLG